MFNEQYTNIIGVEIIEHLLHPFPVIEKLYNVNLRTPGVMVFSTPEVSEGFMETNEHPSPIVPSLRDRILALSDKSDSWIHVHPDKNETRMMVLVK